MASFGPTNNSGRGFWALPQELLDQVLSLLSTRDVLSLIRSSRRLYNQNRRRVYRKYLEERPVEDDPLNDWDHPHAPRDLLEQKPNNRDFLCSWAALRGFPEIIHLVLEEGLLDVNTLIRCSEPNWFVRLEWAPRTTLNNSPWGPPFRVSMLHLAVIGNQAELALWLLKKGADPLIRSEGEVATYTPITTAIIYHSDLAFHLAQYWKPEAYTKSSSLFQAIKLGNINMVIYLCGRGADVNDGTGKDGTPLITAAECSDHTIAEFLLKLGADVNKEAIVKPVPWNNTPSIFPTTCALGVAAAANDENMMRILISHGADINKGFRGQGMLTLLNIALGRNAYNVVEILLKSGANPNLASGPLIWTPYGTALRNASHMSRPNPKLLDLLIAYGADPNKREWSQPPAIFLAMQLNHVNGNLSRWVVNNGVDVNEAIPEHLYGQYGPRKNLFAGIRWTALHEWLMHPAGSRQTTWSSLACEEPSSPSQHDHWRQSLVAFLLDRGADPFAGYRGPADMAKTPLGYFIHYMMDQIRSKGLVQSYEPQFDAMLSLISHPRGAQSIASMPTEMAAQLLGLVAIIPTQHCLWYGPTRSSRIHRFAKATCAVDQATAIESTSPWIETLVNNLGYWSLWEISGRKNVIFKRLRDGAGKGPSFGWCLDLLELEKQFVYGKI